MDENMELLNFIYQNSEMGVKTIRELMGICKDEKFKLLLGKQLDFYNTVNEKVKVILKECNTEPKEINALSNASTYIMIKINTLTDKSPSHLAEMMIQGSTMGIIDMRKRINEYDGAKNDILDLAKMLLEGEEKNVEELKPYL